MCYQCFLLILCVFVFCVSKLRFFYLIINRQFLFLLHCFYVCKVHFIQLLSMSNVAYTFVYAHKSFLLTYLLTIDKGKRVIVQFSEIQKRMIAIYKIQLKNGNYVKSIFIILW